MSTQFHALWVEEKQDGIFTRSIVTRTVDDLPPGDVLIRVHFSSLNYKDALSATGKHSDALNRRTRSGIRFGVRLIHRQCPLSAVRSPTCNGSERLQGEREILGRGIGWETPVCGLRYQSCFAPCLIRTQPKPSIVLIKSIGCVQNELSVFDEFTACVEHRKHIAIVNFGFYRRHQYGQPVIISSRELRVP